MDLKDTLLTPRTNFPMKAGLAQKEPIALENWKKNCVYEKKVELNKGNEKFVLLDGPPYANGKIHIGHIENKVLKDIINRYKSMSGYDVQPIFGWDTHGLPIENALLKNKKIKKDELSTTEFRKLCLEFAKSQVELQKGQFERFGLFGDMDKRIYCTFEKEYEAKQLEIFSEMAQKGLIYKGSKPIYWSPSSQSALADAEVEYHDKKSPAVYIGFDFVDQFMDSQIVIWTTTPWTIPGNQAVSIGEDISYSLVELEGKKYILATKLVENFAKDLAKKYQIIREIKKEELIDKKLIHPLFNDKQVPIVYGHHVSVDAGTGIVHIAPGHGEDDFLIGLKNKLEVLSVVDHKGVMNKNSREFADIFYEDANKLVTEKLSETGNLVSLKFITHSYPHDWRTKKPVIYRATPQWFASIDKIRTEILEATTQVEWINEWGSTRLTNMIKDRIDWCISRQRKWGVPIPIIYNEDETPIIDKEVFDFIINLIKENGSDIWFDLEAKDLLPPGYKNVSSPNGNFYKEKDIMDVWFDSGSAHLAIGKERHGVYPADLYLEGSDQYRGWFNSSLITGVAVNGQAPYKKVLSHGFTLDGKGYKMSKSLGNTIDPLKLVNQYGADIVRLWVATSDYQNDTRISDGIIKQSSELYRRIRNGYRFILGNLFDFPDNYEPKDLKEVDYFILQRLDNIVENMVKNYEEYQFKDVIEELNNFFVHDLSSFYFDFSKDVLYIEKADSTLRRNIQYVLKEIITKTLPLITPIIPFTANEIYQNLHNDSTDYIFFKRISTERSKLFNKEIDDKFIKFLNFRDQVNKELEKARDNGVIGKSLEAKLTINASEEMMNFLNSFKDLELLLIVSELDLLKLADDSTTDILIEVDKYSDYRCERCWKFYLEEELNEQSICPRCNEVISGN